MIAVKAMIVPANVEFAPRVAELPTCQKTLQALASLMRTTELAAAVSRADVAWKTHTEVESPWPSRVRIPLRSMAAPEL